MCACVMRDLLPQLGILALQLTEPFMEAGANSSMIQQLFLHVLDLHLQRLFLPHVPDNSSFSVDRDSTRVSRTAVRPLLSFP